MSKKPESLPQGPTISNLIRQIRQELTAAEEDGKDNDLQFEVGPIEIEVKFVVQSEEKDSGGGKLDLKVFSLSAGMEDRVQKEAVQTLRLTLTPVSKSTEKPKKIRGKIDDSRT